MTRNKKLLLLGIAIIVFGCCACWFWRSVISAITEVSREPTRLEYARMDKRSGRYLVGDDKEMAYGRWTHTSNKYGCSWRVSGMTEQGYSDNIESGSGKEVTLRSDNVVSAEYFETSGCGTWKWQGK